jgi:hypothetical protein
LITPLDEPRRFDRYRLLFFAQSAQPVFVNGVRGQRVSPMNPLMWLRIATWGRATKHMFTTAMAYYLDLAAGKSFLTENAKPLIVQRLPASEMVAGAQDPESLVKLKMNTHYEVVA